MVHMSREALLDLACEPSKSLGIYEIRRSARNAEVGPAAPCTVLRVTKRPADASTSIEATP